jgi:type IV secretion system protein VirD4
MRRAASVLGWLTRAGVLAIAAPILAVQLVLYLGVAVVVSTVLGMILIELLGGSAFQAAWWHDPFLILLALVACLVAAHAWSMRTGVPLPWAQRPDDEPHGSARFASPAERRAFQTDEGLLIGRDLQSGRLLRYSGPAHLLTLAPTRSGKGVGTVIPN